MARVKINPKALKWARIDAGYDYSNLPNHIKEDFEELENGKMPTWNQLQEISKYLKKPTAFFFRKNLPEHFDINFVGYGEVNNNQLMSPKLTLGVRDAVYKRDVFLELMEDMNYPKVLFSRFKLESRDVNELSTHIGKILDVDLKKQKSGLYNKNVIYYNHLKDKFGEKLGILIFELSDVSLDEMRALCIYFNEYPIILLNSSDSVNSKIFLLFHGLTHLLLGKSSICDVSKDNSKEELCNAVATQFLRKNDIIKNHDSIRTNGQLNFDEESLMSSQLKYNGKLYLTVLLYAYNKGIINEVDLSQYAGIRLNQIDELSEMLF